MQIANPLYDTVFKYLLDDEQVAKLFLSELLGREIIELTYDVQEMLSPKTEPTKTDENTNTRNPFFTILRLDFGAKVRYEARHTDNPNEHQPEFEKILIEVQKTNHFNDSTRFRRYLGMQYGSSHNISFDDAQKDVPISIYPIYFLGEGLTDLKGHGIIHIRRQLHDGETLEIIPQRSEFIDAISHDGMVVCINELKDPKELATADTNPQKNTVRAGALKLLSIFKLAASFKYEHFLTIDENDYDERYRLIIRRLQKAAETVQVRKNMDDEDDYFKQFFNLEKKIDILEEEKNTARAAQATAEAQAVAARGAQDAAEAQAIQLLTTLVRVGKDAGMNAEQIAAQYTLPLTEVVRIMKRVNETE